MRVCVLVRSLTRGGAERQAATTAAALTARGHRVDLVTFRRGGAYAQVLSAAGLEEQQLGGPRPLLPVALWRRLRTDRPDVVLSYLAGPNLVSLVGRGLHHRPALVWGVRSTSLRLEDEVLLGRLVSRVEPRLSRWCDAAVTNSAAARDDATARGFRPPRFEVVPNVIDVDRWRPDPHPGRRADARRRLGLPPDATVVGRVGRIHPVKDLPTYLRALAHVVEDRPEVRGLVVGDGEPAQLRELVGLAASLGIADRVVWHGGSDDLSPVYAALDVLVSSSSYGESFPNVVAEASASGVPCVGTDLGATRDLIGDGRFVVPPADPAALASATAAVLDLGSAGRAALGSAARRRIVERFGPDATAARLERVLTEVLESVAPAGRRRRASRRGREA